MPPRPGTCGSAGDTCGTFTAPAPFQMSHAGLRKSGDLTSNHTAREHASELGAGSNGLRARMRRTLSSCFSPFTPVAPSQAFHGAFWGRRFQGQVKDTAVLQGHVEEARGSGPHTGAGHRHWGAGREAARPLPSHRAGFRQRLSAGLVVVFRLKCGTMHTQAQRLRQRAQPPHVAPPTQNRLLFCPRRHPVSCVDAWASRPLWPSPHKGWARVGGRLQAGRAAVRGGPGGLQWTPDEIQETRCCGAGLGAGRGAGSEVDAAARPSEDCG